MVSNPSRFDTRSGIPDNYTVQGLPGSKILSFSFGHVRGAYSDSQLSFAIHCTDCSQYTAAYKAASPFLDRLASTSVLCKSVVVSARSPKRAEP